MYLYKTFRFLEQFRGKIFTGEVPTLPEMFLISAEMYPDSKCFTTYNPVKFVLTYSQAKDKILRLAAALLKKGLKKGDRVILTGKNSPEWAVSYFAISAAGGVIVPIDYSMKDNDTENIINFSDVCGAIADEEKYDHISRLVPDDFIFSLSDKKPGYVFDVEEEPLPAPVDVDIEDMAAILYTSGTTGVPKGVMLTHANFVKDCYLAQMNMNIYHEDVFYALLPIHHSYTMLAVLIEAVSVGSEIAFARRLVIKEVLNDLKDGKVTMFLGVPMLFNKLLDQIMKGVRAKGLPAYVAVRSMMLMSGFVKKIFGINIGKKLFKFILDKASLSSIRICISGGGPLAPKIFKMYNQLGLDFVQGYGLTETSPIVTLNPIYKFKVKSVGKIIPEVDVKFIDPDENGIGEIALRSPIVMKGYYKNQKATDKVMDSDNFFHTGDVGYRDKDNYLYLTGRKKNIIVTAGGKNVFPEELEDKFQLYSEIEQVLIRGYINENMKKKNIKAEEIEALIYPSEEIRKFNDAEKIKERIREIVRNVNKQLLRYMKITRINIVDKPFEMTSTKKIKRYKIKK